MSILQLYPWIFEDGPAMAMTLWRHLRGHVSLVGQLRRFEPLANLLYLQIQRAFSNRGRWEEIQVTIPHDMIPYPAETVASLNPIQVTIRSHICKDRVAFLNAFLDDRE